MIFRLCTAAAVAAFAFAGTAHADGHKQHGKYGAGQKKIIVSCYRGPWKDVIWDRPNPVFIDSLVDVGYGFATAQAIATRICRDAELVGDPEALKATMRRIWRDR